MSHGRLKCFFSVRSIAVESNTGKRPPLFDPSMATMMLLIWGRLNLLMRARVIFDFSRNITNRHRRCLTRVSMSVVAVAACSSAMKTSIAENAFLSCMPLPVAVSNFTLLRKLAR